MRELSGVELRGPLVQIDGALLDELELLLGGLQRDTPAHGAATFHDRLARQVGERTDFSRLTLADADGTPLAEARWATGDERLQLTRLAEAEHGPGREFRLTTPLTGAAGVVLMDRAPSLAQLASLKGLMSAGDVLLLVAGSTDASSSSYARLLSELQAAGHLLPGVRVAHVVVPEHCDMGQVLARLDAPVLRDLRGKESTAHGETGGIVVMFTGLSGSGKSTLARSVRERLQHQHLRPVLLDGDDVRRFVSKGLGFSREDRETNVERIGWIGARVAEAGGIALCAPIAPFDETRKRVRELAEQAGATFHLVHVSTPLQVCETRDRKGLYAQARAGDIKDFTGIDSPYEVPSAPALRLDLGSLTLQDATDQVLALMEK
ncbi:adenylyl-sulfate kinase [Glutamicibacter soli]|uniref:Adenylyl-sulfate kinase n=1 Tax=Glutamicibacter soli TaxID=453836 RepID=A0A6L9G886_9MICC|nr:adenylyl-sulfate kinase [Glutamicibacter soli]NAZ16805.1 adenylyl-sulfate kinase [Glutamicibacter soli]